MLYNNETIIHESVSDTTAVKHCITCSKQVRGRTDKKFCDDYCRNNYNNRLKAESNNLVRNINNALGKNRRVLESFFNKGERLTRVSTAELLLNGFHFKYFTHRHTNKRGNTYFFCYDYGYRSIDNEWFIIMRKPL